MYRNKLKNLLIPGILALVLVSQPLVANAAEEEKQASSLDSKQETVVDTVKVEENQAEETTEETAKDQTVEETTEKTAKDQTVEETTEETAKDLTEDATTGGKFVNPPKPEWKPKWDFVIDETPSVSKDIKGGVSVKGNCAKQNEDGTWTYTYDIEANPLSIAGSYKEVYNLHAQTFAIVLPKNKDGKDSVKFTLTSTQNIDISDQEAEELYNSTLAEVAKNNNMSEQEVKDILAKDSLPSEEYAIYSEFKDKHQAYLNEKAKAQDVDVELGVIDYANAVKEGTGAYYFENNPIPYFKDIDGNKIDNVLVKANSQKEARHLLIGGTSPSATFDFDNLHIYSYFTEVKNKPIKLRVDYTVSNDTKIKTPNLPIYSGLSHVAFSEDVNGLNDGSTSIIDRRRSFTVAKKNSLTGDSVETTIFPHIEYPVLLSESYEIEEVNKIYNESKTPENFADKGHYDPFAIKAKYLFSFEFAGVGVGKPCPPETPGEDEPKDPVDPKEDEPKDPVDPKEDEPKDPVDPKEDEPKEPKTPKTPEVPQTPEKPSEPKNPRTGDLGTMLTAATLLASAGAYVFVSKRKED